MSEEFDYAALLRRAIETRGAKTGRERVAIYKAAQGALHAALESADSPVSVRRQAAELRKLSSAIKSVDAEYRILSEKEAEDSQGEARRRIATALADVATVPREQADVDDDAELDPLALEPLPLPPARAPIPWREKPSAFLKERLDVVQALIERRLHLASSRDRAHYAWLLIEPCYQVSFVVIAYWMLNREYIMDVHAAPFAVIGVAAWLMFRTTITKVIILNSEVHETQLSHVSRLDELLSQALFVAILYLFVVSALLLGLAACGYTFKVNNLPLALAWWWAIWVFAFGIGMACAALASRHMWARRAIPLLLRKIMVFSGIVLVTEQLPPDYKAYFLWNPLIHAMQSLRGALFLQYESIDARPVYFFYAALVALSIGLASERAVSLGKSPA